MGEEKKTRKKWALPRTSVPCRTSDFDFNKFKAIGAWRGKKLTDAVTEAMEEYIKNHEEELKGECKNGDSNK